MVKATCTKALCGRNPWSALGSSHHPKRHSSHHFILITKLGGLDHQCALQQFHLHSVGHTKTKGSWETTTCPLKRGVTFASKFSSTCAK